MDRNTSIWRLFEDLLRLDNDNGYSTGFNSFTLILEHFTPELYILQRIGGFGSREAYASLWSFHYIPEAWRAECLGMTVERMRDSDIEYTSHVARFDLEEKDERLKTLLDKFLLIIDLDWFPEPEYTQYSEESIKEGRSDRTEDSWKKRGITKAEYAMVRHSVRFWALEVRADMTAVEAAAFIKDEVPETYADIAKDFHVSEKEVEEAAERAKKKFAEASKDIDVFLGYGPGANRMRRDFDVQVFQSDDVSLGSRKRTEAMTGTKDSKNGSRNEDVRYPTELVEYIEQQVEAGRFMDPSDYISYRVRRFVDSIRLVLTMMKTGESAHAGGVLAYRFLMMRIEEGEERYRSFGDEKTRFSFHIPRALMSDLLYVGRGLGLFFYGREGIRYAIMTDLDVIPEGSIISLDELRSNLDELRTFQNDRTSTGDTLLPMLAYISTQFAQMNDGVNVFVDSVSKQIEQSRAQGADDCQIPPKNRPDHRRATAHH